MRSLSNRGVKFATKPSSGIYYALPKKDFSFWEVVYRREDDNYSHFLSLTHYDLFEDVVKKLEKDFDLTTEEVKIIGDHFCSLPRGRVVSPESAGEGSEKWIILHGNDAPSIVRHQILTAFGLLGLLRSDKVEWKEEEHEKMEPEEKKIIMDILLKRK